MSGGAWAGIVCALGLSLAMAGADVPGVRTLIDQGKYAEAEKAALALVTQLEGDSTRPLELADALDLVLEARRGGRRLSTAGTVALAERALRLKETAYGPDDPRVAQTLIFLGLANAAARNADAARTAAERALAITERGGSDRIEMARAWNAIGSVRMVAQQWPGAIDAAERALVLARRFEQPLGLEASRALFTLGFVARAQDDTEKSARSYEEALAIEEVRLGLDHPSLANILSNLSGQLRNLGDVDRARVLQERLVRLLEATPGAESQLAFELIELSTIVDGAGEYADALTLADRAVTLSERALGPRSTMLAAALGFQAALFDRLGDHSAAAANRVRVIDLWTAAQGAESMHAALALNGLAESYLELGRLDEATAAVDRALANAALQKQPSEYSRVLQCKGRLLIAQGRRTDARAMLEKARDIAGAAQNHVARNEVGQALTELARLERTDGQPAKAVTLYREAIALFEREMGPYNIRTSQRRVELAAALAEIGALDEARAALLDGEAASIDHLRLMARTLSDRRALSLAAERQSGLDLAITLATARKTPSPADIDFAWQMLIHGRTVVLDEMAARQRRVIAEADNPGVRERWITLNRARTRLANVMLQGPQGQTPEDYQAAVERARTARDLAERALADASLAFRAEQDRSRAGVKDVTTQLQPGMALVAFVRYTPQSLTVGKEAAKPAAAYAAFVARPGVAPIVVPLGTAETIDGAVAKWREGIQAELMSGGLASRRVETTYRVAGGALRALIWDPLAPHVRPSTAVFIVPDGAVHLVDFGSLPTGNTGYLVESLTTHYLLAERDLVKPRPEPDGHSLLAVGSPDFDRADRTATFDALSPLPVPAPQLARNDVAASDIDPARSPSSAAPSPYAPPVALIQRAAPIGCDALAARRFDPLPATRGELKQIADLWRRGGASSQDSVVLLGDDRATETAFKALAPGRRVLHVATHGFFVDRSCSGSSPGGTAVAAVVKPVSAATRGADLPLGAFDRRRLLSESPLLRSGLVLAGANRHAPSVSEEDDGILTAEEIAGLDLSAAQWAVLSACDTGRGDWQAGEGVLGLRRAFQVAGARTVILSLWPVIDSVASHWMAELYRGRFVQGISTSHAARAASRRLLAQRRAERQSTHPLYWSGFIATGDWR